MIPIAVDPYLTSPPGPDVANDAAVAWLRALEAWLAETERTEYEPKHFLSCTAKLDEKGRFVDFPSLRAVVQRLSIDINVPTILRRVSKFFRDEARDIAT